MRKLLLPALAAGLLLVFSTAASAGWNTCIACHNGTTAADKEKLKNKYKTAASFIKAAKESQNPLMKSIQKDENALKDAAGDIGLQ